MEKSNSVTLTDVSESALEAYLATALWSSSDDEYRPLDATFEIKDIAPESIATAKSDLAKFFAENRELIEKSGADEKRIAHDFWLTRNRHGAGFWDGDYPSEIGRKFTESAHAYGECCPYAHDSKVYLD